MKLLCSGIKDTLTKLIKNTDETESSKLAYEYLETKVHAKKDVRKCLLSTLLEFTSVCPRVKDITFANINKWIEEVLYSKKRGLKKESVSTYIHRTNGFLVWAYKNKKIDKPLRAPTLRETGGSVKVVPELSYPQYLRALNTPIPQGLTAFQQKMFTCVKLCLATGLRRSEMISLKARDIKFTTHIKTGGVVAFVAARRKGGAMQNIVVVLTPALYREIKDILSYTQPHRYFLGVQKTAFYRYCKEYTKQIFNESLSPHCLRHIYTRAIARATDLSVVSEQLGHCCIEITKRNYASSSELRMLELVSRNVVRKKSSVAA